MIIIPNPCDIQNSGFVVYVVNNTTLVTCQQKGETFNYFMNLMIDWFIGIQYCTTTTHMIGRVEPPAKWL